MDVTFATPCHTPGLHKQRLAVRSFLFTMSFTSECYVDFFDRSPRGIACVGPHLMTITNSTSGWISKKIRRLKIFCQIVFGSVSLDTDVVNSTR